MKSSMRRLEQKSDETAEEDIPPFETLDVTYTWMTRIMSLIMIYPNPKTDKWRLLAIPIETASALPYLLISTIDIIRFFMANDLANLIRISTVSGPFASGFFKITVFYYKRRQAETIINEIQRDYAIANKAPKRIRKAVQENIKNNRFYEKFWTVCVAVAVTIFPLQASVMNAYNNLKEDENRYMITDLRNPLAPDEERFSTPFFHIMFAYSLYCCLLYFLHFTSYDNFMMVALGHACLKFDLFRMALEDVVAIRDVVERRKMLAHIVHEQNRTMWFVEQVHETFHLWLGLSIIGVMAQLCSCLFYIMEGFGFDERYATFITVTTIYFYLICSRCHEMKATAELTPTGMYCCGWETVQDQEFRKALPFMIARFQKPVRLSAFNFFVFDMELFLFVVKTAYSLFTLLQNK